MAASTFITKGSHHPSLMGSNEKRLDAAPDGTLWLLVSEPTVGKCFMSADGGATWKYASGSDLTWNSGSSQGQTYPSFYVDAEGYAHVSWTLWNRSPQLACYARGKPVSGGGWSWTTLRFTVPGSLSVDSDVVSFRTGTGWTTWLLAGSGRNKVHRLAVSATGALSVVAAPHGPPEVANGDYHVGALEFAHPGDGKTPEANPHVLMVSGSQSTLGPMYGWQAVHGAGSWAWGAPVVLDASARIANTVMATVWDGSRLCTVYEPNDNVVALRMVEWSPGSAPVRRDPPALPSTMTGDMMGVSVAHDPVTDDLYVVAYAEAGEGDIYAATFTRATLAWSAWVERTTDRRPVNGDGKVQMVRHARGDAIEMVWGGHGATSVFPLSLYYQRVAQLVRAPGAPALSEPPNGARADLASGATFGWDYRGTGQGDAQQGWVFRRTTGGVVTYWNAASQAFGTAVVVNPGADEVATFPPGAWANGATYTWSVRTRSSSGQDGTYAPDRTVVATTAPRVLVTGPSGLLFTESTPVVSWDYVSSDAQRTYEVRVFVDAPGLDPDVSVPVWASGLLTSSSARSIRVDQPLLDGKTYRAFVMATSVNDLSSDWADSLFALSLTPPTGPSVRVGQDWTHPHEVPYARLRVVGRTNHMGEAQARGVQGWEADANTTLTNQAQDAAALLEEGMRLTAVAAGAVAARSALGSPPPAPVGQPQPAGPLSFPVYGGETYTAVAHFRSATAARAARVVLRWYASDEGEDGNDPLQVVDTTTGDQSNVSPTEYGAVSVTVTAPAGARRVTVVPQVLGLLAGEHAYVSRLSVHPGIDTRWQPGGFVTDQTVRVERSLDGVLWSLVAERVGVDLHQRVVVADRLMPLGLDVRYRAFTDVHYADGARLSSGASPLAVQRVDAEVWVIRDPTDPLGEVNALVTSHTRSDDDAATVSRPAGRRYAIVDTEGVQSAEGSITIYVPEPLRDQTVELLQRSRPLVMQTPRGQVHLVHFLHRDYEVGTGGSRTIPATYVEVG